MDLAGAQPPIDVVGESQDRASTGRAWSLYRQSSDRRPPLRGPHADAQVGRDLFPRLEDLALVHGCHSPAGTPCHLQDKMNRRRWTDSMSGAATNAQLLRRCDASWRFLARA